MKKNDFIRKKTKDAVSGLPVFISILIILINDHFLKDAGLLPASVTGKLSDFAFLFFAPIIIAYIIRAKSVYKLIIAYLVPTVLFTAINLNTVLSSNVQNIFSKYLFNIRLWPDPTDLIALAIIPVSLLYLFSDKKISVPQITNKRFEYAVIFIALFSILATSQRRHPTHEPIYMEWEKMRAAVKIEKARPIRERGKIYIKGNYLLINEPNEGIHVIDNSNKKRPVAKLFIKIPGNVDIAIKDSILYADSFTDLLLFQLTLFPQDIYLIKRIENAFEYDPYQIARPKEEHFYPKKVDDDKGVVIGWKPIWGGNK